MNQCPFCSASDTRLFCSVPDPLPERQGTTWRIQCCDRCRAAWTLPRISSKELAGYYPPSYLGDTHRTLEMFFSGELARTRAWRNQVDKVHFIERFIQGGRLLDVGCGDGRFLWALHSKRWDRTGVEPVGPVVELVRARFPEIRFVLGDVFSPELQEETFDVITLWHVIEHFQDPFGAIQRLSRMLRPNGLLVVSTPNFAGWQARLFREHWYAFDSPRHLFHFSPIALTAVLQNAGLQIHGSYFFSRVENFHQLKHTVLHWSKTRLHSRVPYYATKPLLLAVPWLESWTRSWGVFTMVAKTQNTESRIRNSESDF
jgi:2-polyprenyl-3-methyl-5-hydroxy-6-metoxy-1,4-benzoquinol methylase